MNAEQVIEKILSEAQTQADVITSEARAKAADAQSELEKKLADYRQETAIIAENAGKERKEQMLASARMRLQKEILTAKCELLDEAFAKAVEHIKDLSDSEYLGLIENLMAKAVETGGEEVIIGKDETRITDAFIKQVNRKLGTGFKGNLLLANERANISGGFILRRGKVQINVSTEVLVAQAREKLEMELAEELFSN
ncbi:MAG: V-type ATP synthase subunit E [Phycisphaerae bacterium]|nr:V-type ATP synthase subunit E [Phycisphaerae bacterium]